MDEFKAKGVSNESLRVIAEQVRTSRIFLDLVDVPGIKRHHQNSDVFCHYVCPKHIQLFPGSTYASLPPGGATMDTLRQEVEPHRALSAKYDYAIHLNLKQKKKGQEVPT